MQCTVLCTVPVTVWTLFMDTVHMVSKKKKQKTKKKKKKKKKKEYKIFKNFLVGDLIYKIFIWQLL